MDEWTYREIVELSKNIVDLHRRLLVVEQQLEVKPQKSSEDEIDKEIEMVEKAQEKLENETKQ